MSNRVSNKKVSRPNDRGKHTAATLWFSKMRRFPQLTRETETAMAVFAREGRGAQEKLEEMEREEKNESELEELHKLKRIGEEARVNLILHTTGFAAWFANKQAIKEMGRMAGLEFMDIIQSAHEGLTIAADKFDPDRNTKFSTYAFYWMRQRVLRQIAQNKNVHVPEWVYTRLRASEAALGFIEKYGRNPTDKERIEFAREHKQAAELAEKMLEKKETRKKMEQRKNDLKNALAIARNVISLQQELSEGGRTLEEIIGGANPEEAMVNKLSIEKMKQLLLDNAKNLDERERQVLYASYFHNAALQEIGNEMGITRERVRQIRAHALVRLRIFAEKEGLTEEYGKTIPGTQQLGTFCGNPRKKSRINTKLKDKITFLNEQGVPKRVYSNWNVKSISMELLKELIPRAKEEKLLEFLRLDVENPNNIYYHSGVEGFLKRAKNLKEPGSKFKAGETKNYSYSLKDKITLLEKQGVPKRVYSNWNLKNTTAGLLKELIPKAKKEKLLEFLQLDVKNPNNIYYHSGVEGFLKRAKNLKEPGSKFKAGETKNYSYSLKDKITLLEKQGVPKRVYSNWNLKTTSAKLLRELIPRAKEEKLLEFLPLNMSNPNKTYHRDGIRGFLKNARENVAKARTEIPQRKKESESETSK